MEGRLFGVTEAEKNHQERVKAHALLSCQKERAILQRCFRESWFGWCVEEHREFWDCFLKVGFHNVYVCVVVLKGLSLDH